MLAVDLTEALQIAAMGTMSMSKTSSKPHMFNKLESQAKVVTFHKEPKVEGHPAEKSFRKEKTKVLMRASRY